MPQGTPSTPIQTYARLAGLGYLVIILTGIFAEFLVRSRIIVPGNAAATAANMLAAQGLFRMGLASEFLMLLTDAALALALYVIFKPYSRNLALLAAFFRLAHASIVGGNLLNTYVPLLLLGDAPYLSSFAPEQIHGLILLFLNAHSFGYVIGLAFFGVHCLVLGYMAARSGYVPRVLGILLMIAGLGYLTDSFGRALLSNYAEVENLFLLVVFLPAFIGEVSFCLWLLVKGVRIQPAEGVRGGPETVGAGS